MEKKNEEWTINFISPKSLAEEMLVSLVKTGLKTYREVTNNVASIKAKALDYKSKAKETVQATKNVPKMIFGNIRLGIQKKIDAVNAELAGIKTNINQKINDIKDDKYEVKQSNITINIPKPQRPKTPKIAASDIGLEIIKPAELAQTLHESTCEIKQSSKEVFKAFGKLAEAVAKCVKYLSPVKHKEATVVAAAR